MIAAAVLLLVLAAVLIVWILAEGTGQNVDLSSLGLHVNVSPLVIFLLGALTLFLILAALRLFLTGSKRGIRNRRERKDLQKRATVAQHERDQAVRDREQTAGLHQPFVDRDVENDVHRNDLRDN